MTTGHDLFSPERCETVFGMLVEAARRYGVRDVEAILGSGASALTRFANNAIHQNVAERNDTVSVRVLLDGRTARATTNRSGRESLERVVEEAVALARLQQPDPDLPPLAEPEPVTPVSRWFETTARARPENRARAVAEAIAVVEEAGQTAAGICSTGEAVFAVYNTRGVAARHTETMAQFSITAMTPDSSGWAKASACRYEDLDPAALARRAVQKAAASRAPRELAPGRYTVVLEPAAVLDLAGQMFPDFSATALRDGRSFLKDRMGAALFGPNISIRDDVFHPLQAGAPFDGEGVPRQKLELVEKGTVREIAYSRQAAALAKARPTGHGFPVPNEYGEAPMNIVIEGGDTPIEDMISSTARGILVTRVWYIREVDPYAKIMTGMTRDGTFLIEDGRTVCGIRNFRFNQALPELLQSVEALSPAARVSGEEAIDMVAPAMKARRFNFTEVTRF